MISKNARKRMLYHLLSLSPLLNFQVLEIQQLKLYTDLQNMEDIILDLQRVCFLN